MGSGLTIATLYGYQGFHPFAAQHSCKAVRQ